MTKSALRQDYFQWLCTRVELDGHDGRSYLILAKDLHKTIFIVTLDNDDNRAEDGRQLREDYAALYGSCAMEGPCTVLELLIGIAERMDFELSDPYDDSPNTTAYFWELLCNLGIDDYDDDSYFSMNGWFHCKDILNRFMQRDYRRNGKGGLFPLRYPKGDQRCVEIWYQMHAYLQENYRI